LLENIGDKKANKHIFDELLYDNGLIVLVSIRWWYPLAGIVVLRLMQQAVSFVCWVANDEPFEFL
jgi:hypothetical protein